MGNIKDAAIATEGEERATDIALPAAVEITPIAAATDPKGPRIFLRAFISPDTRFSAAWCFLTAWLARAAGAARRAFYI